MIDVLLKFSGALFAIVAIVYPAVLQRAAASLAREALAYLAHMRSAMSFRKTFALGYPLSIAAFIIMAGMFVSAGHTLPNLFDPANTAFYTFAGFMAGIVGYVFALPLLIITEVRNEW